MADVFREQSGAIAAWFGLMLPVFVGMAALAVDISYTMMMRHKLQVTASSAALAGAGGLRDTDANGLPDDNRYRELAVQYTYLNASGSDPGSLLDAACDGGDCEDVKPGHFNITTRTFTPFDAVGYDPATMPLDAVKVHLRLAEERNNPVTALFAGIFGREDFDIHVNAIGWAQGGGSTESCMIALDPSAPQTFHVEGDANVVTDGCGNCVNSTDPEGLWLNGEPSVHVDAGEVTVNASDYHIEGAADIFPSPTLNAGECTDPFSDSTPFAEEFADTTCAEGTLPTIYDGDDFGAGDVHVPPGLHCGGISFKSEGHVVFEPGIHHIKNGTLLQEGTHTFFGDGVTFLVDNATLDFGGSQDVQLSVGADGSQFLVYENPDGPHPAEVHIFRGDADANYEGIIYTPDRDIEFVGETYAGELPPDCFAVIANSFHFTGTTDISLNSAGCGGALDTSLPITVRLVD